jgi:D-alanyl-lipoteichoic acid acyltransferase DltB (MBOAT superfamily)
MLPQFERSSVLRLQADHFALGITIFVIGLFKKVVLADGVAAYATPIFDAARDGAVLSTAEAWAAALGFTLQLYFDFSGYSDMAIGLARMFGIRLPFNFASPYKSTSIIEFWRRWHITLSRFLRDYLFILLGGNRRGATRGQVNLFITMVLGGLWHGAGWTFIVWGALHGAYLVVNHAFRRARKALGLARPPTRIGVAASTALTFVACVFTLVFFRAETLESAVRMSETMLSFHHVTLPLSWRAFVPGAELLAGLGVSFEGSAVIPAPLWLTGLPLILFELVIVFAFPNTQEYAGLTDEEYYGGRRRGRRSLRGGPLEAIVWRPGFVHGVFVFALAMLATGYLGSATEFLYYQF